MGFTAVLDYGVGNLQSVLNALEAIGQRAVVAKSAPDLCRADRVILPGVGAFPSAMAFLRARNLVETVQKLAREKPFLGICLGMQLLFDRGDEQYETAGLGLIPGTVRKLGTAYKLPHIGWNSLELCRPCVLFDGLSDGEYVYFVHSYAAHPENGDDLAATADYGAPVTAAVARGSLFGCQFHPEKSGEAGLTILKNFCKI